MIKKALIRMFSLLCVMVLLLGCQEELPGITETQEWEVPQLNYGVLEYDKLEVLPWYSGRTEATSFNRWAETEKGYYQDYGNILRYADKADLSGWVPVCKNPNCNHQTERCSAYKRFEHFRIKDNRIYTVSGAGGLTDFYRGDASFLLMSMDPDGGNRELAYAIDRQDPASTPISIAAKVCADGYFYHEYVLNTDGTHTRYLYWIKDDGTKTVIKTDIGDEFVYAANGLYISSYRLFGERTVLLGDKDETTFDWVEVYRLSTDSMTPIDLQTSLSGPNKLNGSYLSGDIIRCYRQNDGYYDINIQTGKEVKVADAQLKDGGADIVLPNCIVESTMAFVNPEGTGITPAEGEHKMVLFDGERWRSVELPPNILAADAAQCTFVWAVTSDKIIIGSFNFVKDYTYYFYTIDLRKEELKMEYLCEHSL